MLELGPTSAELHAGLAEIVQKNGIDLIYLAGTEMHALAEVLSANMPCFHASKIDDLIESIVADQREGDVIMAKASLGMNFAKLIDHLLETGASES